MRGTRGAGVQPPYVRPARNDNSVSSLARRVCGGSPLAHVPHVCYGARLARHRQKSINSSARYLRMLFGSMKFVVAVPLNRARPTCNLSKCPSAKQADHMPRLREWRCVSAEAPAQQMTATPPTRLCPICRGRERHLAAFRLTTRLPAASCRTGKMYWPMAA